MSHSSDDTFARHSLTIPCSISKFHVATSRSCPSQLARSETFSPISSPRRPRFLRCISPAFASSRTCGKRVSEIWRDRCKPARRVLNSRYLRLFVLHGARRRSPRCQKPDESRDSAASQIFVSPSQTTDRRRVTSAASS